MKNKIDLLEERITNINNILGELGLEDLNNKISKPSMDKEKFNNLTDAILFLQKKVSENNTVHFKDVNAKCIKYFYFNVL